MTNHRILAMLDVVNRVPVQIEKSKERVSKYYGSNIFGLDAMQNVVVYLVNAFY